MSDIADLDDEQLPWSRIVDRVYYENAGVETLRDVTHAFDRAIKMLFDSGETLCDKISAKQLCADPVPLLIAVVHGLITLRRDSLVLATGLLFYQIYQLNRRLRFFLTEPPTAPAT